MGDIIIYEHHGVLVKVDEQLKGTHRRHCLCFRCASFKPGQEDNCQVAEDLFAICKLYNVTTPVFECRVMVQGRPDLSQMPK